MMPRAFFACIAILVLPHLSDAQDPIVLLADQEDQLLLAARVATEPTLFTVLSPSVRYLAMIPGPGDDSVFLLGQQLGASPAAYSLQQASARGVQTVRTFIGPPGAIVDIRMDDAGAIQYLVQPPASGIYTAPGSAPPTRVVPIPATVPLPHAFVEDPETGDWILFSAGDVWRVARGTQRAQRLARFSFAPSHLAKLMVDASTGDVLVVNNARVVRVDAQSLAVTTVASAPTVLGARPYLCDLNFDPASRGIVFSGFRAIFFSQGGIYGLLAADGTPRLFNPSVRFASFRHVVSLARPFTPQNAPRASGVYRLTFHGRGQGGRSYQAAFSFGSRPGLSTPIGVIPLRLDALMLASVAGSPLVRNASGILDATGRATIELDLRSVTVNPGLRLHCALVTLAAGRLAAIYGPHSFSLR